MITPEVKAKWLEALRSGSYKQGHYLLANLRGGRPQYCCLGVLCEVAELQKKRDSDHHYFLYQDMEHGRWMRDIVPENYADKIGLTQDEISKLIDFNDQENRDFTFIASWIEENL